MARRPATAIRKRWALVSPLRPRCLWGSCAPVDLPRTFRTRQEARDFLWALTRKHGGNVFGWRVVRVKVTVEEVR